MSSLLQGGTPTMASPMGPPMLPGYSLRVQLFAPTAHALGDKPIRCFRVVTSPEVTVRDFCQEASRIHEINYGEPLAIKKVQDDQEFDITQSEILGNLFATAATVRVVQASANSTVRDSIPPTSALRFDPATSRKRDRSSPNGFANPLKSNKRQRIAELNPDQPLPSREEIPAHANGYVPDILVPNSQESVMLGSDTRHVRPQQIEETPEPPASRYSPFHRNGIADRQNQKNNEDHSSPVREASARAQSQVGRAKSASYHIQRATERGRSVSTAATSPPSVDGQRSAQNITTSASKRKRNENAHRSINEDTIYDTIVSEEETVKAPKATKLSLKARNSPSGLQGIEWAKNKAFNTPPNINRRSSASRETPTTSGELPLTPSSKEREQRKREQKEENEAKKSRLAAAEAAEQRQREAEEAKLEEERQAAEAVRARREEEEQRQVEEFNRAEAERKAKAEKLRKGKEAREAREAEEARIAKVEAERRRKETEAAMKRAEEEKLREEARVTKGKAKEKVEPRNRDEASAELGEKITFSPVMPRSTSRARSSTPLIPKGKPGGMKSILKSSQASSPPVRLSPEQSNNGSHVEDATPSAKPRQRTVSFDVVVEPPPIRPQSRILPPKPSVSKAKTPIQPPKRTLASKVTKQSPKASPILPPKQSASVPPPSKSSSTERSASTAASKSIVPPSRSAIIPPAKISTILPPPRITSVHPATAKPTQALTVTEKSKPVTKPQPVEISSDESDEESEEDKEVDGDVDMADVPAAGKDNQSLVNTKVIHDSLEDDEDEESQSSGSDDEDVEMTEGASAKENAVSMTELDDRNQKSESDAIEEKHDLPFRASSKAANGSPKPERIPDIEDADDVEEEDPDATQSQNSSPRESRSPVVFSQNPSSTPAVTLRQLSLLNSKEDDEESDNEPTPKINKTDPTLLEESTTTTSDSDSSEGEEGAQIQVPKSSPPVLPTHSARKTASSVPPMSQTSKRGQMNTQTEVNQQLTSSLSRTHSSTPVPIPASSTTTRPPMMKFGASLSSLNLQKNLVATSSQSKPKSAINGLRKPEEEGSESESEDSSSSSSDDEDDDLHIRPPISTPEGKPKAVDEDESDTTSTSDSDEEKSSTQRVRDQLSRKIAGVMSEKPKGVTQSASKAYGKEKKKNKYLTGYSFSQPGL